MKTREILILGLIIIAVCVVSLIPFSNSILEGASTIRTTAPVATTIRKKVTTSPVATTIRKKVTTSPVATTISGNVTTSPVVTTTSNTLSVKGFPTSVTTNVEFLNAIIYVLAQPINQQNDKVSVYNIQGLVSPFNTQNSATLLGEMTNPNNLTDSRLFLQYMNWFASHCPLDSNTCTGLC